MLSVLIPIYNFDVTNFVHDLTSQCKAAEINHEIICVDDGSDTEFKKKNQSISTLDCVTYTELPGNIGRSAIRNLLAEKATFNHLLFVDCDSKTLNANYISNYLKNINNPVVYGGRCYDNKPSHPSQILRWHYGVKRESHSAEIRKSKPYLSFMANNFLIHKDIYLKVKMDEKITQYGHEDTLFGQQLQQLNISITHIDNPLVHIGLESNSEFLKKTINGVENLAQLIKDRKISNSTKLIDYYYKIKKLGLQYVLEKTIRLFLPIIQKNLTSARPQLFLFDLYKLYYLVSFMR